MLEINSLGKAFIFFGIILIIVGIFLCSAASSLGSADCQEIFIFRKRSSHFIFPWQPLYSFP